MGGRLGKIWLNWTHALLSAWQLNSSAGVVTWALQLSVSSYMVDAADQDKMEASKNEFHNLLDKPQLNGIPVLVLANKRDLPGALDEREVIDRMYVL